MPGSGSASGENTDRKKSPVAPPRTNDNPLSLVISANKTGNRHIRTNDSQVVNVTDSLLPRTAYIKPKSKPTEKSSTDLKLSNAKDDLVDSNRVQTTNDCERIIARPSYTLPPTSYKRSSYVKPKTKPTEKSNTDLKLSIAKDHLVNSKRVQTSNDSGRTIARPADTLLPTSYKRSSYVKPKTKPTEKSSTDLKPSSAKDHLVDSNRVQTTNDSERIIARPAVTLLPTSYAKPKTKPADESYINLRPTSTKDLADRTFVQTTIDTELGTRRPTDSLVSSSHKRSSYVKPKTKPTEKSSTDLKPTSAKYHLAGRSLVQTTKDSELATTRPKVCSRNSNDTDPGLIIMIMNAGGAGTSKAVDRRKCIAHTVNTLKPKILLFQEFTWKGIAGKIWESSPLPSHYQYFGHSDASVLYDVRDIIAEELKSTDVRRILEHLQRTSNNAFNSPFPMDFDPLPRMCACLVSTIGVPFWEFICVSWHGPWARCSLGRRKTYFQYLLEFLKNIMVKFKRPLLVGGDFNIDFPDIIALIKHPFKKYEYTPSKRRQDLVKDYFITSFDMDLNKIGFVDISGYESCLDHDPVTSCLSKVIVWPRYEDTMVWLNHNRVLSVFRCWCMLLA